MKRRSLHPAAAMGIALMTFAFAAQPTIAYDQTSASGNRSFYTVTDEQAQAGVACKYENNSGASNDELDKITVRLLHSHTDANAPSTSKVGFRYIIQRNTPPHSDGVFETVYSSPIVKKSANDSQVAFFGPYTWKAPEGTRSRYRVKIVLYWYEQGNPNNQIGYAKGLMEAYQHKLADGGTYTLGDEGDPGYCRRNYHGI